MTQKLLTVAEAAHRLGLSEDNLTRMAKAGEVKCLWIGGELLRFHPDDLEGWLRQAEAAPRPLSGRRLRQVHGRTGWDRVWDFINTYDFYAIAGLLVAAILGSIFLLHR